MKTKFYCAALLFLIYNSAIQAQEKKSLDHSVYDGWKSVSKLNVSDNGQWVSFEINPQKGDGWLILKNPSTGFSDSVKRGYEAVFSPNSDFVAFKIKVPEDSMRKAKMAKEKDDDLPKDSLGIWIFKTNTIKKVARVKSFKVAQEETSWMAYLLEKSVDKEKKEVKKDTTSKSDTTTAKKKPDEKGKKKKKKQEGSTFVILNPALSLQYEHENVTDYTIAKRGGFIAYISIKNDSVDSAKVGVFDVKKRSALHIYDNAGTAKKIALSITGNYAAFIFSADTAKVKTYAMYLWENNYPMAGKVVDTLSAGMNNGWSVSENSEVYFSEDGNKLFFGTALRIKSEKKDTLLEEEKVKLDLWSWTDPLLQSQQLKDLDKEKKRTYLALYNIKNDSFIQLADELVQSVNLVLKGNSDIALGISAAPYKKITSWEAMGYKDYYTVSLKTGEKKLVLQKKQYPVEISASGKYILWWNVTDSSWYSYVIASGETVELTKNLAGVFYDDENDNPEEPSPYGIAVWLKDDASVLIYDKYDIWKVDPENRKPAIDLTKGSGKTNHTSFRYLRLDKEVQFVQPNEKIMLKSVSDITKQEGFCTIPISVPSKPKMLIMEDVTFYTPIKAKSAEMICWQKSDFRTYPDVWFSNLTFQKAKRLSYANPQQSKYFWGTVEMVRWNSLDGKQLEGLLYKPENLDTNKKYPMIVYFYEKYSDQIHTHYVPSPSRSIVNFPLYTSNGYLVFVPDIVYKAGEPGESAYNAIIPGVEKLLTRKYINEERMGIQGQSWGGYQVAYLVTRTNRFKAAMAGAPVTNMTSAYGGIRWESGQSRMHQYEDGQSRIGGTLWNKMPLYIKNSPLFAADKVNTPLLMMSNDNDGAVPWSQGIEYFSALRRLNKPVWMLNYNGDEHNLTKRPNRRDLSIRMMQFFDYYLKDSSAPEWMLDGIPAIDKGEKTGYDLKK